MTIVSRLRSWLRATRDPARAESEMDAELRAHLNAHAEHLIAMGIAPEEAYRRAELEFGPMGQTKRLAATPAAPTWRPRSRRT